MTARLFSILRRKPGLVDFITPLMPPSTGVAQYRLKTDTTPTGAFATTVMTVRGGYLDPSLVGTHSVIQPGENVRIVFKPSNFGLSDTAMFWLKLVYIDAANAEMASPAPSAPTLVLPPFTGNTIAGFTASAPTSALQIDLPRAMDSFRLVNPDATNGIGIAFQEGGPEVTVTAGKDLLNQNGAVSSIWVRGIGGATSFSATFSYANPR